MKIKYLIVVLFSGLLFTMPAYAESCSKDSTASAPVKEKISVVIGFSNNANSFAQAKAIYNEKVKMIFDLVKKQNIKTFDLLSADYNVYKNWSNGTDDKEYIIQYSNSYAVSNIDDAFAIADLLTQNKFSASINGKAGKVMGMGVAGADDTFTCKKEM